MDILFHVSLHVLGTSIEEKSVSRRDSWHDSF